MTVCICGFVSVVEACAPAVCPGAPNVTVSEGRAGVLNVACFVDCVIRLPDCCGCFATNAADGAPVPVLAAGGRKVRSGAPAWGVDVR